MTPEQDLLSAYPNVRQAVTYVELIMCTPDEDHPVTMWEILKAPTQTPDYLIKVIRDLIGGEVNEEQESPAAKGAIQLAYIQTYHSEFTSYIAGKLGMM